MATVLDLVKHYQNNIEKYSHDEQKVLRYIDKLFRLDVKVQHLQETGVGRTVNALRKEPGDVGKAARALVYKWKQMVAAEESDQEGDHETTTHNGHGSGKESDDSVNQLKIKEEQLEKNSTPRSHQDYKQINGDHSGSKRKYHSSEEEEPEKKKSKHSSSSEKNDYKQKQVEMKSEQSESDSQDSENSQSEDSDSEMSESSEEDRKPSHKIKTEPTENHKSPSKHSHSNHRHHKVEHSSSKTSYESEKHLKHHSSQSLNSEKKKEKSHSLKDKSSRERDSSEKKHKDHKSPDKDRKHKEESKSSSKHSSDKYKSSSQKADSSSEKGRNSEKSTSKPEKPTSSSQKHKSSSEKEISTDKHKSKDSSSKDKSSSSKEKLKESRSSKDRSSSHSHKSEKKHSSTSDSSSKSDSKSKSEKSVERSRDKKSSHKSSSSSSSHKSKSSSKSKEDIPKKKVEVVNEDDDGIDCGSGASFAEALGMIVSTKSKKKSTPIKDAYSPNNSGSTDLSPAALLAPTAKLAPLPNLEISALPEISPNYKPRPPPKFLPHFSDEDAMSAVISSKNQRTKVYSGNKTIGRIPTLYEMCVQILQEHIDALEYTGGVPYEILKPVVDKATPQQLFMLEHYNAYLIEDTDHLWQKHCEKHFRNKKRQEMETWREMYMRCQEEQEIKLRSLTENIKLTQEAKKAPIKQTKMAYVDTIVKPPRNIARKQALHGTAHSATASPAARVAALASAPNVLKGGSVRPPPAAPVSSSSFNKPKKAPLMQKALQFMRGRKR